MTAFWIAAGVLLAVALALLLPSLLRTSSRNQPDEPLPREFANLDILREQLAQLDAELASGALDAGAHRSARAEIERRVLDEESGAATPAAGARTRAPRTALALGLFIPALAIGLYALLGNRDALSPQVIAAAPPAAAASDSEVEAMVEMLAKRLETMAGQPGELEGWVLLARTYGAMQRFAEADRAYERAIALAPQEAQLYADRADMVAMKQGRSLSGLPMQLVGQALQIDPNNLKALVLAGSEAFERADYAAAGTYWTRARVNLPADSELAANLDNSLAEVRTRTGGAPAQVAAASAPAAPALKPAQEPPPVAGAVASVSGIVSLAPSLAATVAPNDTVFIFARAAEGPRMPLAILRHRASELPIRFTLDDSQAMSPEMKLSKFPRVVVGARVSKSGNAMTQPGDLIAAPVPGGGSELKLVIDQVQP
jgi:cytochrome c-type biogenesis protein CcmH